jgi:hypothetical protein
MRLERWTHRHRTEADIDGPGLVRMSAMLSGKMTPLDEAVEMHEEP